MRKSILVTGLLSVAAFAACSTQEEATTTAPVAKFAASPETTSELGVTTWDVQSDNAGDERLIGRDAAGERVVELTVHREKPGVDVVDVESDAGTLRLTPDGVESASSADARRLGRAVGTDLGKDGIRLEDNIAPTIATYGVTDARVQASGVEQFGWNLFNQYRKINVGGACRANTTRDHGDIHSDYGALGLWTGWQFSSPNTDCNAVFEMWCNGGHWDNFYWRVWNRPVNLAVGRPASQSSTDWSGFPTRATDGNTDGNFANNSVTHTLTEFQPWWQVDLGSARTIGGIVLFNRTDCCSDRLADFDIKTSYDGVTWDTVLSEYGPAPSRLEYALASPTGRYVRVQLRGTNILSLAEVQVYAP